MYWGLIWITLAAVTMLYSWRQGPIYAVIGSYIFGWGGLANALTEPGGPASWAATLIYLMFLCATSGAALLLRLGESWLKPLREQIAICLVALACLSLLPSSLVKVALNGLFGLSLGVLWWHMLRSRMPKVERMGGLH